MTNDKAIPVNCVFCGSKACVVHFDRNMYYTSCSNPECKKHDKYAYLGNTENNSVEQWNFINRNLNRTSTKKRKNENRNI